MPRNGRSRRHRFDQRRIVHGLPLLDLAYDEDSSAHVDMNVFMTDAGRSSKSRARRGPSPSTAKNSTQRWVLRRRVPRTLRAPKDGARRTAGACRSTRRSPDSRPTSAGSSSPTARWSREEDVTAAIAAGDVDDERATPTPAPYGIFHGFQKEARAQLRDVEKRLEQVNQATFDLTAERGVAVKRIEATEGVLRDVGALQGVGAR